MFSTLRTRFGIPGVISVIALVFAMFGGAYAASNSASGGKATASAKAKQGPRGKTGKTGPAGPTGPQGAAGAQGPKGDAGASGAPGQDGTSVANTVEPKGVNCKEGGTKLAGSSTTYACNGEKGKEGSPWTAGGKLPSGATETGVWGTGENTPEGLKYFPISYTLPLQESLDAGHAHLLKSAETSADCPGVDAAGVPQASPGQLCVYVGPEINALVLPPRKYFYEESFNEWGWAGGSNPSGAYVPVTCSATCFVLGSWAVTAE
jgi:hypothetical protein